MPPSDAASPLHLADQHHLPMRPPQHPAQGARNASAALGSGARAYVVGMSAGLLARALSLAAGMANLWLLTNILSKEQFAGYVFVIALVTWLALLGTAGLDHSLVYRLSRAKAEPGVLVGGERVSTALLVTLPLSATIAVAVAVLGAVGGAAILEGFGFWAAVLAPLVVTICLSRVFEAWFLSRGRVAPSVLVPAVGEVARAVALAIAFVVAPTMRGVGVAVVAAAVAALLLWVWITPAGVLRRPAAVPRDDLAYGSKVMLARAANDGTHQVDVLLIGLLAVAASVADYAVAARLAILVGMVKALLAPVLTPRLGRLSTTGDRAAMLHEYDRVRLLGLAAALIAAALFAAFGRPVLAFFNGYEASYPLLMILIAGYVVSAGFGSNAAFLTIMGHAGWTLVARVALLVAIVALNVLLIPRFGAIGAALAMAVGMTGVNVLLAWSLWRVDALVTVSPPLIAIVAAAAALLLLLGFDVISSVAAALCLAALAGILLVVQRPLWYPMARRLLDGAARTGVIDRA